jgi:hypothetical protein
MAAEKATKKELTTVDPELERMINEDAGKGVSTDAADNLVPLVYVLQPLSPQVMDGPAHIEGARAGDIWLKNAPDPIVQGKAGIWFMPCTMYMRWTEWVPRDKGGGFVASYDYTGRNFLPQGAVKDEKEKSRPRFWFPATGNECVETRYEAGFVWRNGLALPFVIPFKSTGHSVSRGWMTKRTQQLRPDGRTWPAWTHLYKLTTTLRKNNFGQWFVFEVGDPIFYLPGYPDKPNKVGLDLVNGDYMRAYTMGQALEKAFETGAKREEEMETDPDVNTSGYSDTSQKPLDDEIPF